MCGICGIVDQREAAGRVRRMAQAMIHRGPDSDGFLDRGSVSLGMRRLKIIDLATGDQPIYNEDGQVAIVFNGEIYNFPDLVRELKACGHHFATHSDTEAIVHAYEEWGTDCPTHLRGMFAFAIYDQRRVDKPGLFIARDRLGIKPLYLWRQTDQLVFASEVRAVLASGCVPKRVSAAGLYTYLAFGSVQEPLTLIAEVVSLPPGAWLWCEVGSTDLQIRQETYWRPPIEGLSEPNRDEVRSWLADSVQSHLLSDVPLGAFLSGGLDSGSIVALGSQAQPMRTFTIGFDNWSNDERQLAELTAKRWNTIHTLRVVSQADMLADLPKAIASMDQPTVDGVNSWYVSREAKRSGLTVALSGIGGDELFAGYPSFTQVPRLKELPVWPWLARFPGWADGWPILPGTPDARSKLAAYTSGQMSHLHPYYAVRGLFTDGQVNDLLASAASECLRLEPQSLQTWRTVVEAEVQTAQRYDRVGEVSWLELSQYMRSTLLRDTDMMSMAHSLEVRVPLADHRLVEHMLPVRSALKLEKQRIKPLLVSALNGLLPPTIVNQSKKTFTFPFENWLKHSLFKAVADRLSRPIEATAEILEPRAVSNVWLRFERGRTNWARPWALYVLGEWFSLNLS